MKNLIYTVSPIWFLSGKFKSYYFKNGWKFQLRALSCIILLNEHPLANRKPSPEHHVKISFFFQWVAAPIILAGNGYNSLGWITSLAFISCTKFTSWVIAIITCSLNNVQFWKILLEFSQNVIFWQYFEKSNFIKNIFYSLGRNAIFSILKRGA
jgi:hypothetical protein